MSAENKLFKNITGLKIEEQLEKIIRIFDNLKEA